jgi:hypothetical protein
MHVKLPASCCSLHTKLSYNNVKDGSLTQRSVHKLQVLWRISRVKRNEVGNLVRYDGKIDAAQIERQLAGFPVHDSQESLTVCTCHCRPTTDQIYI